MLKQLLKHSQFFWLRQAAGEKLNAKMSIFFMMSDVLKGGGFGESPRQFSGLTRKAG